MPKTKIQHDFDYNDEVLFAHEDKIIEGRVVAMRIKYDWDHDNDGIATRPDTVVRYVVQEIQTYGHGTTFVRAEHNLIRA